MCFQPYWISARPFDRLTDHHSVVYDKVPMEFLGILRKVEKQQSLSHRHTGGEHILSQTMDFGWRSGRFWYSLFLQSIDGGDHMFEHHIRKRYCDDPITSTEYDHFSKFSFQDVDALVRKKVAEGTEQ